ncbi:MAG: MBL fold metallo-hydrolase [Pseudomonadota bacterium]
MKLTRRDLVGLTLAAPALITTPARARLGAPLGDQNTGWARFSLGAFQITVISDGNLVIPTDMIGSNVDRAEVMAFLEGRHLDPRTNFSHTNHVLIDTGAAKVLVDVGSGERFQPTAGRLSPNMEAAGIDPGEITHVALTHAHPDHVWGMLDDFDELRFPEAAYTIAAAEFDWWTAKGRVDEVPEAMQAMVVGAQNALRPVVERTAMAVNETEIVPGIRMIDTPGHTLGHMAVIVESAGEQLMVLGDAVNHAYAGFEHPDWHFGFDMDRDQAVATRRRLLDMAATDRIAIAAYHLPFPGIGHVIRRGDAYQFLPEMWRWGE